MNIILKHNRGLSDFVNTMVIVLGFKSEACTSRFVATVVVVRDYDGQVFMREFNGGLLCSGYPPIAKPAYVDEIPEDLKGNQLPEDWDYFSK